MNAIDRTVGRMKENRIDNSDEDNKSTIPLTPNTRSRVSQITSVTTAEKRDYECVEREFRMKSFKEMVSKFSRQPGLVYIDKIIYPEVGIYRGQVREVISKFGSES
jgi:hypothetical protein